MIKILTWIISWIISALLVIPCMILSLISGFKIDYHHQFHLWWYKKFLESL